MWRKNWYRQELEELRTELSSRLQQLITNEQGSDWLKTLYEKRTDRFISDNDKIWTTGQILIPIAIGAFGIYATLTKPDIYQVLILALLSVGLLVIWELIAVVHRRFQDIHECWLDAIEQRLSIKPRETAIPRRRMSLKVARRLLIVIVFAAWTVIIVLRHILPLE